MWPPGFYSPHLHLALASPLPTSHHHSHQPLIPVPETPTYCHATVPIKAKVLPHYHFLEMDVSRA